MKIRIYGTSGLKESYDVVLEKYNLEKVMEHERFICYITINSLEDLMDLATEIYDIDGSELIITYSCNNNHDRELEIYNDYRE